jgi:hypothetical protein
MSCPSIQVGSCDVNMDHCGTILGNILLVEVLIMNWFMICRLVHPGDSP